MRPSDGVVVIVVVVVNKFGYERVSSKGTRLLRSRAILANGH